MQQMRGMRFKNSLLLLCCCFQMWLQLHCHTALHFLIRHPPSSSLVTPVGVWWNRGCIWNWTMLGCIMQNDDHFSLKLKNVKVCKGKHMLLFLVPARAPGFVSNYSNNKLGVALVLLGPWSKKFPTTFGSSFRKMQFFARCCPLWYHCFSPKNLQLRCFVCPKILWYSEGRPHHMSVLSTAFDSILQWTCLNV